MKHIFPPSLMVFISAYMDSSITCRDGPHVPNLQLNISHAVSASIFSLVHPSKHTSLFKYVKQHKHKRMQECYIINEIFLLKIDDQVKCSAHIHRHNKPGRSKSVSRTKTPVLSLDRAYSAESV